VERSLLSPSELEDIPSFPKKRADYSAARVLKKRLLHRAFSNFSPSNEYEIFLRKHEYWLPDYALFTALKDHLGGIPWNKWPEKLKFRDENALEKARESLRDSVDFLYFCQYLFFSAMEKLRKRCDEKKIELLGDLPIYVHYDSADVWAHPEFFHLDDELIPVEVAGVPPDYFSKTGQLWGNPIYNWDTLRTDGFSWWMQRLGHSLSLFHCVRIDHFRGLLAYWSVPHGERTAENGTWRNVPSEAFLSAIRDTMPSSSFLAENLGVITPDVTGAMERMGFPGMAVVLFSFGGDMKKTPHIPHNYTANLAAYTGTHDNNTALGWFRDDASKEERHNLERYIGRPLAESEVPDALIRMVMASVAQRAIIPIQDYLDLGGEARMNKPSTPSGNWEWRAESSVFTEELSRRMLKLSEIYGRN